LLQILAEHLNAVERDKLLGAGAILTPDEAIAEALRS
jgi:hypothetical protein